MLKRGGKVYTKVIPNAKSATLIPIFEDKVIPDSIVYSDSFKSYNVLDVSEFKHYRLTTANILLKRRIISMELRIFGIKQALYEKI